MTESNYAGHDNRVRVRVTVEGRRMACFHLKVESILSGDLTGESLSRRDQPDQPDQEPMPWRQNRTSGPVAGSPKGPERPSGSGDRTRTSGELVTLVTKKDGDGESAPNPPGEGSTLGHLPPSNRTRKPDQSQEKALPMEEGWL